GYTCHGDVKTKETSFKRGSGTLKVSRPYSSEGSIPGDYGCDSNFTRGDPMPQGEIK
ncbi:hypothetical protein KI387_031596, partial [Taxus chinensis]